MTDKEKAQAYDEAFERAKEFYNSPRTCLDINALTEMFPKLKESEDERISKIIRLALIASEDELSDFYKVHNIHRKECTDWLEKRKEHSMSAEEVLARAGLKPYKDGNQWCILAGDNIQEGICGFGDTIDEALYQFLMEVLEKQKENPKTADSIPSDCVSDAKCEDRWHKVKDSLPNSVREVLCKDAIGNFFLGRYYKSTQSWKVVMYDDCDKSNEDNPPVVMWIDIPSEKQKEQIPYIDFIIKPHKGSDINPYDMRVSEAQEYAINRGFGIPFNDGEVYVDERHMTQTIGNILRWADEHPKEQKDYNKLYEDIAKSEWFKKAYEAKSLGCNDEQKEQDSEDEECDDFTIYHPLKNGKGEYECIPYSFYGSLTSFSEDKDLIDFLRACFYTEEECNEWIEKQKEQKPAEWNKEDKNRLEEAIEVVEANGCWVRSDDAVKQVSDFLKSLPERFALQQSQEWSEEDEEMISNIISSLRGYMCLASKSPYYTNHEAHIQKEIEFLNTLPERLSLQPKQEWSEKDETCLEDALWCVMKTRHFVAKDVCDLDACRCAESWLKSFRDRFALLHWKPSEEQMEALNYAYSELFKREDVDHNILGPLQNLIDTLTKL